ncbi:MAG: DUF2637 domain-containing protein [Dactylosporangium sp.]|nr:DUF2637 domain-containing protein [Dactylosporangium sp.]NNJ62336.1 DUF2637 domain-containing protein [Dactylosporangium sp.]
MTDEEYNQYARLRWGVRAVLTLGVAASVAANILHARNDPISQTIAAWPPIALLLAVELVSRVPIRRRWLTAARICATIVSASIAAYVSYWHMTGVAARYGEETISAHLLPLSVDGLIVIGSVCLVELGAYRRTPVTGPPPPVEIDRRTQAPGPQQTRQDATALPDPPEAATIYAPSGEEDALMYAAWQAGIADGQEPSGADLARAAGRAGDASGIGRRAVRRYRDAHATSADAPWRANGHQPTTRGAAP